MNQEEIDKLPGANLEANSTKDSGGMEPDDLPCSRNARSKKDGRGTVRPSFLLAEAARSECAPSMHAVKDSLAAPLHEKFGKWTGRSSHWTRAVEDQSAPIPEERTSKLGGKMRGQTR